ARVARQRRLPGLEGPLVHLVTGLFFLGQAAVLGLGMVLGLAAPRRRLVAYVVALLVGWAGGVTLGHLGKVLSLSAWAWWPARPRAEQAALYPRRVWLVEAIVFAVGIELLLNGVLGGSEPVVLLATLLLAGAAANALAGAAVTVHAGRPALRRTRALISGPDGDRGANAARDGARPRGDRRRTARHPRPRPRCGRRRACARP